MSALEAVGAKTFALRAYQVGFFETLLSTASCSTNVTRLGILYSALLELSEVSACVETFGMVVGWCILSECVLLTTQVVDLPHQEIVLSFALSHLMILASCCGANMLTRTVGCVVSNGVRIVVNTASNVELSFMLSSVHDDAVSTASCSFSCF